MKKTLTRVLVVILMVACLIPANNVYGATGSASVTVSSATPTVGNQITLKITVKDSSGIGAGVVDLIYDTSYLKCVKSSINNGMTLSNNNENIRLLFENASLNSSITSATITVTFKTLKEGSTSLKVNISQFVSCNGGDAYEKNFTKSLTIKAKEVTPTTPKASSDATLKSLFLENLELEEEFSSSVTEYTVYAPTGTDIVNVIAQANSAKAQVSLPAGDVTEGWNKLVITVTAEDGTKQEYVINAYIEETPAVYFDNGSLGAVINLDKAERAEGFEESVISINNEQVTVFVSGDLYIIYLVNIDGEKDYYIMDKTDNSIIGKYSPVILDDHKYIVLETDYEQFEKMNEQFIQTDIDIDGQKSRGWKYAESNMKAYRIIYLMDEVGHRNLYSYHIDEDSLQLFTLPEPDVQTSDRTDYLVYGGYAAGAAGVMCLLLSLMVNRRRKRKSA